MKHLSKCAALFCAGLISCTSLKSYHHYEPPCGKERWKIKTLRDSYAEALFSKLSEAKPRIEELREQTHDKEEMYESSKVRHVFEKQLVSIRAMVKECVFEPNDGDYHLLLTDGRRDHMIAEVPNPDLCSEVGDSKFAKNFRKSTVWIQNNLVENPDPTKNTRWVIIEGIPFQDRYHGQEGSARNDREIHPIINIKWDEKE